MTARTLIATTIAVMMMPSTALAANCALRSPDRQIYQIFPEATAFRTFETNVDGERKRIIEESLGSTLDQEDVGKHTAYLVLKDEAPIGFVHARTESGGRGSVELVWAFDLDLTVKDFRVQRSREPHSDEIRTKGFRDQLVGRNLMAIRALLTRGNDDIDLSALQVAPEAREIVHVTVVCALKTRLITEMAFTESIISLRQLGHVYGAFPKTDEVKKAVTSLDAPTAGKIEAIIGSPPNQFAADSVTVLIATGSDGTLVGTMTLARWTGHETQPEIWCAVGPDGAIERLSVVGAVDDATRQAFASLEGQTLADASAAGSAAPAPQRCALELLALHASVAGGG